LISLKEISYQYPDGTIALSDISLDIPKGKNVAFLGANGSGKSSLFLLLAGLIKPQKGVYSLQGADVKWTRTQRRRVNKTVGLVFQDPDVQLLTSSVYKEVAYGPSNLGLPAEEIDRRVNVASEMCGIRHLLSKVPHSLSFGQKKSVAIASILSMETDVVVFDEPLAWLDPKHKAEMIGILALLKEQGKTVLVSTHNTSFAYEWADEIVVLCNGCVSCAGTPVQVFCRTDVIGNADLAVPLAYKVSKLTGQTIRSEADIVEYIKGKDGF